MNSASALNLSLKDNFELSFSNVMSFWQEVKNNLRSKYGQQVYRNWLIKLDLIELQPNNKINLVVPSNFVRDWVENNYLQVIFKMFKQKFANINSVQLLVDENYKFPEYENIFDNIQTINKLENIQTANPFASILNTSLDSRYTFENFVVGTSNELAYFSAKSVAESTIINSSSNPLFLYGGVGLGKTHLMHAIANHIANNGDERKVVYLSAEKFMYLFVQALRNKNIMLFKEQFRSVDVLMVDDIQFICGKDSTQEEFFHTFNTLIDNNRQVIISCDRSPSDLADMEERVKSRLGWGLVIDIHNTNYELRLGILQSKCEQLNINVELTVLELLASKITSNVRELEGALNKVIAYSNLTQKPATLDSVHNLLKDLFRSTDRSVSLEEIQRKVCEYYNIKLADMLSAKRMRSISRPRQIAMYLCKILTDKSLVEIGKKFSGKDHTTVMHAIKQIELLIQDDKEIYDQVRILTKIIEN